MPTPPPGQLFSTFQIGTWNPTTDTWTLLYDLNQPTTGPVFIMAKYPQWVPGEKYDSRSQTIRTVGERIVETNVKNAHWKVKLSIRGASTAAIAATIRTITQALEQAQLCIRYSAPEATQYLYFDVRKTTHNLHQATAQQLIAGVQSALIDFEVFPLARGDRITLQNLLINPGFESQSGASVQVFTDSFANLNAYTVAAGSAPSLTTQKMTIPVNTVLLFGSPVWGAINTWSIRFQMAASCSMEFGLHFTDGSNLLWVDIDSTGTFALNHTVAGTTHTLATNAQSYTATNFYWLQVHQFPQIAGNAPYISVSLYNDSAGSIGTLKASIASTTFNTIGSLVGQMSLSCFSGTMVVGGSNNSNQVALFAPGGWLFTSGSVEAAGSVDGLVAYAPTSTNGNVYAGGAVQGIGALRIDLAPSSNGSSANWSNYTGGSPVGTAAIPVLSPGNIMAAYTWVRTNGIGASGGSVTLIANEYDTNGTFLRATTVANVTTNQAAWTQIGGSWTTGANTVFVGIQLGIADTTGGSPSATVWFDNAQVWNATTTGAGTSAGSMPFCELRFMQSPSQLLLTGLLGDFPAPMLLQFGTFIGTLNTGHVLNFAIGRAATPGINKRMVAAPLARPNNGTPALSAAVYGGTFVQAAASVGSFIFPSAGIMVPMPDTMGIYHLVVLLQTAESTLTSMSAQYRSTQSDPAAATTQFAISLGPILSSFTATNTWIAADLGVVQLPNYPLTTATAQSVWPWDTYAGVLDTSTTANQMVGWHMLLPFDAETLIGQVTNPAGYQTISNQWVWFFNDALTLSQKTLVPQAWQSQAIGTTQNVPNSALPSISFAVSGPGTNQSAYLYINPTGSPFLRIDPTTTTPNSAGLGVNQFAALITDDAGTILPFHCEIQYSPYYYYQR